MNPNMDALIAALCLLGETKNDIAIEYLWNRQQKHSNYRDPSKPWPGELGYLPGRVPDWAHEQKQQDLFLLQEFAFERINTEQKKSAYLLVENPHLNSDVDFREYLRTIEHANKIICGQLCFIAGRGVIRIYEQPSIAGYRIGSWPKEDA